MLSAASLRSVGRCWLLGLLLWPATTGAQQQLATLQGTITDQSGAIVPGVTVVATSVDTGAARTAMTNEAGVYRLPGLEPGRYRVAAELTGFNRAIRENVTLEVGATVGLPFVLQPGNLSEEIEVRGQAAVVQTERADISSVVERKRIETTTRTVRTLIDRMRRPSAPISGAPRRKRGGQASSRQLISRGRHLARWGTSLAMRIEVQAT
jgi:Carboxypeptidase regulatory-like domain